ncbi:gluconokinase [Sinomonas terrae]|uniref:Gluconokinase n=1 Tax=Sinomonas terrae TaxID=2908838 RepID=A0ABS9U5R8_9MICC|nr:gluconokinase [Sinomonas terrae]MCH6472033.1 gluconokinase [Sinomonas terrae]
MTQALHVIVMGVSGSGKSTVGELLAKELGGEYLDGDVLHPQANIDKMAAGIPLTDEDREPWLRTIGDRMASSHGTMVIGCSALRRVYRDIIRSAAPDSRFVHLVGTHEILAQRMKTRPGHFMPPALLDSQIETLEDLEPDEVGEVFDIAQPPEQIAHEAAEWLRSGRIGSRH